MEDDETIKQRNLDLSNRLYREFKGEAGRRGLRMRDALAQAVETWVQQSPDITKQKDPVLPKGSPTAAPLGVPVPPAQNTPKRSPDYVKEEYSGERNSEIDDLLRAVKRVLESTNPIAGPALTTNIVAFDLLISLHDESERAKEPIKFDPDTQKRILRLAADAARLRQDFARFRARYSEDTTGDAESLPEKKKKRA